jgi:hypothetical protein
MRGTVVKQLVTLEQRQGKASDFHEGRQALGTEHARRTTPVHYKGIHQRLGLGVESTLNLVGVDEATACLAHEGNKNKHSQRAWS